MTTRPRKLIILRHGETDGNRLRIMQTPQTPLNALGKQQARLAAERIAAEYGTRLVIRASDYTRAQQTAAALSAISGQPITDDPQLRERSLGDLRGRAYSELGFDPFAPDYHPPSGESWEQFFQRVAKMFDAVPGHLDSLPDDHSLVLVTHGLVCRALAEHHLKPDTIHYPPGVLPADDLADHWPNTSLTVIEVGSGARANKAKWIATTFNCGGHLEELSDAGAIA